MYDKNKKYRVTIIDSGIRYDHPLFANDKLNGFGYCNGKVFDDFSDAFGHGTAIFNIIKKQCLSDDILNIKLYNIENSVDEEDLISLLYYLYENVKTDFIHMSLGLPSTSRYNELKAIFEKFDEKNVVTIAAFDNFGSISYPAAFEKVIGVTSSNNCVKVSDFEYYPDPIVNIAAKGALQKLAWVNPDYILLNGNSFAAAHVTAKSLSFDLTNITRDNILKEFEYIRINQSDAYYFQDSPNSVFDIKRAALFPFSKEMHSLVRYADMLPFTIEKIYDTRFSMYVGATTKHILKDDTICLDLKIEKIDHIDWDIFDTIIVGHFRELSKFLGKEYQKDFIIEALQHGKKVFSFDDLSLIFDEIFLKDNNIYYPTVKKSFVPINRFGKLYCISTPVVGVFGTSSKQGKYTLQLDLRGHLQKHGYSVGQIGTEPTALLFGMDYVYPMGYDASVHIHGENSVRYLNYIINKMSIDKDIILVGSQSGTVPYDMSNISMLPITQNEFLMGTQPDAVLLNVNPYDDIDYIRRTINYIEGLLCSCEVIGLVVFPVDIDEHTSLHNKKISLSVDKYDLLKQTLYDAFSIPVYLLGNEDDMNDICESIILYFSEPE